NRTDTNMDTDIIGDHHGKLSSVTKDLNVPIVVQSSLLNDYYERTEDIQSNYGDPENISTMDPDPDNIKLVENTKDTTTVKLSKYMSRVVRTVDGYARILQDGKHGRSWLLDTRDHVKYYNQLTLRMNYKPGMDSSQLK